MCGIIGYTGFSEAAPVLLRGLAGLAYRGYDSAGIATEEKSGEISVMRAAGKLENLEKITQNGAALAGNAGIGHTRWATHGAPEERNAHPHLSPDGRVAVVHNGIIENYRALKEELISLGYPFYSDTDTEVIPHLFARYLAEEGEEVAAIRKTLARLSGAFALGILFSSRPGEIFAVRRQSPLVVARCEAGCILASDIPALLPYTREVFYPGEDEILRLSPGGISFLSPEGREVTHTPTHIAWEASRAKRDGYPFFMEKEIHEIPEAVRATRDAAFSSGIGVPGELLARTEGVVFVGCGSAYHAGLAGVYAGEEAAGIPVRAIIASEFRYHRVPLSARDLVVAISQSGETADTLAAVREARSHGAYVLAVVNVVGSAIAREADAVFYTRAGPEIAVATTKAFAAQLVAVYALFCHMAEAKGNAAGAASLREALGEAPDLCREVILRADKLCPFAETIAEKKDVFFIGRGADFPAATEGSLKLKEISYLHAEAYAAGELKHGTISLIEEGVPVVALSTDPRLFGKTVSNMEEVRARGAEVFAFVFEGAEVPPAIGARVFYLPGHRREAAAIPCAVALDLLAYEVCRARGLDPDMPRNLAKSVTVE